jgi:hypothetical protein
VQIVIHQYAEFHCEGCKINDLDHKAHLEKGCLSSTDDLMRDYAGKAGDMIGVHMLCEVYTWGMKMLNWEMSPITSILAGGVIQARKMNPVQIDEFDGDSPFIHLYTEGYKQVLMRA